MPRVKRGPKRKNRRAKTLALAKGYYGTKSKSYRMAKLQVEKSLVYAYRDRKVKKRDFRGLFAGIRDLPPNERGAFGSRANAAKQEIEGAIARLAEEVERREIATRCAAQAVDVTLPGRRPRTGGLHPVTIVRRRIEQIFL